MGGYPEKRLILFFLSNILMPLLNPTGLFISYLLIIGGFVEQETLHYFPYIMGGDNESCETFI